MVILDFTKIAVNSPPSFNKPATCISFSRLSSMMNSIQKQDSSTSSITMLSFDAKSALDCATHAALWLEATEVEHLINCFLICFPKSFSGRARLNLTQRCANSLVRFLRSFSLACPGSVPINHSTINKNHLKKMAGLTHGTTKLTLMAARFPA